MQITIVVVLHSLIPLDFKAFNINSACIVTILRCAASIFYFSLHTTRLTELTHSAHIHSVHDNSRPIIAAYAVVGRWADSRDTVGQLLMAYALHQSAALLTPSLLPSQVLHRLSCSSLPSSSSAPSSVSTSTPAPYDRTDSSHSFDSPDIMELSSILVVVISPRIFSVTYFLNITGSFSLPNK